MLDKSPVQRPWLEAVHRKKLHGTGCDLEPAPRSMRARCRAFKHPQTNSNSFEPNPSLKGPESNARFFSLSQRANALQTYLLNNDLKRLHIPKGSEAGGACSAAIEAFRGYKEARSSKRRCTKVSTVKGLFVQVGFINK